MNRLFVRDARRVETGRAITLILIPNPIFTLHRFAQLAITGGIKISACTELHFAAGPKARNKPAQGNAPLPLSQQAVEKPPHARSSRAERRRKGGRSAVEGTREIQE